MARKGWLRRNWKWFLFFIAAEAVMLIVGWLLPPGDITSFSVQPTSLQAVLVSLSIVLVPVAIILCLLITVNPHLETNHAR